MRLLIAIDGPESCGKTTQSHLIANRLRRKGHAVFLTKEPGATDTGKKIENIIFNREICSYTELFLFLADRSHHISEVINPQLWNGNIVICDRFLLSTIAYQSPLVDYGYEPTTTKLLERYSRLGLDEETHVLSYFLDLSLDESMKRSAGSDRIENRNQFYHKRVIETFRNNYDIDEEGVTGVKIDVDNKNSGTILNEILVSIQNNVGISV